jgi:hypothetical protein
MPPDALAAALKGWLAAPSGDPAFSLLQPHAITPSDTDVAPSDGWRAKYSPEPNPTLRSYPGSSAASAIGKVVAAQLFSSAHPTSGTGTTASLMRVTVLADPWHRFAVRARIRRNDAAGETKPIDPHFLMLSAFSPWHARPSSTFALMTEDDWNRWGVPDSERMLTFEVTARDWYTATQHVSLGSPLARRLSSTFSPPGGGAPLPWWNVSRMLDDGHAGAVLRHVHQEKHVIGGPGSGFLRIASRDESLPRLLIRPTDAKDIDRRLNGASAGAVGPRKMLLDVTWTDQDGHEVAHIAWPLEFKA